MTTSPRPLLQNFKKQVAVGTVGALTIAMAFIASWEGYSPKAYLDAVNIWTICHGHTKGVYKGMTATPRQCQEFYESDVGQALQQAYEAIRVPVSDFELAAYTSFVFNLGIGNFRAFSLLKKLNSGDHIGGCNGLTAWVCGRVSKGKGDKAGQCRSKELDKVVLRGLVKRRTAEKELCLTQLN